MAASPHFEVRRAARESTCMVDGSVACLNLNLREQQSRSVTLASEVLSDQPGFDDARWIQGTLQLSTRSLRIMAILLLQDVPRRLESCANCTSSCRTLHADRNNNDLRCKGRLHKQRSFAEDCGTAGQDRQTRNIG